MRSYAGEKRSKREEHRSYMMQGALKNNEQAQQSTIDKALNRITSFHKILHFYIQRTLPSAA